MHGWHRRWGQCLLRQASLSQNGRRPLVGYGCKWHFVYVLMSIGQPLPKYWETFVQTLDNRCSNIGQRLPKHCATVDEVLGNPFPSIGQPLPKYGATVSHVLGNLSQALGNGFRALGHGTPILGELFPNAGKRPPNNWETVCQCLGRGFPKTEAERPCLSQGCVTI